MLRQLALLVMFASACLTGGAAAQTFVYCSEGNPEAINPQLAITGTAMDASRPMFNNLVEFAPGTTDLRPALAESWTVSEDGKTYTFHLRPNVSFHSNESFVPTRPMNADDVVFSLTRQWKDDHPYHNVSNARFDYFKDSGFGELLASVDALDERTVRIVLTRPEAPFLASLAMPFNAILSAEYADRMMQAGTPERLDTHPIGTGPFELADFRKDIMVRYRAFPDYWRGRQKIETLVFSITPTASARVTKLKAGECHVSAFPGAEDIAAIKADDGLRLYQLPGFNIGYLGINTTRPPFDDVRVRRAINLAIDRQAIIDAVFPGTGTLASNPIPPTSWAFDQSAEPVAHDPAAARALLAEAGHADGITTDLWYMPVSRPYNPNGRRIAEMIADDLEELGIRLELKTAEWNDYRITMQDGGVTLALYGWTGDNGDPDNFLGTLLGCTAARIGGNNIARWCNHEFDDLIREAREVSDRERRRELYDQAQAIFRREVPWVPIAHSIFTVAARKSVKGFVIDPLGYHNFEGVSLSDD
ncbi:ABC transporter substrate-binding protein [Mangrovibrevibacter kandeliae]|uniref:ABC transporter substrate-binding protein n=1 Tax=Mangrovibrevibacter kandeliae TaxID=2968473 RepID=UPI002117CC23|nr:ABC transporter substrate-binding protein [Aurantimonas sp. CSK15Z-1]MCQ8782901.1 ABC transporter substrate-binding protein [Aurantimonas sp. CSK15Z-1]